MLYNHIGVSPKDVSEQEKPAILPAALLQIRSIYCLESCEITDRIRTIRDVIIA